MPVPSDVQIKINGVDRTSSVLYQGTRFEASANAGIGTFGLTVRDRERTLSFTTGDQVELLLDGKLYYGGWVMQRGLTYAFPVVDTTTLTSVKARQHVLKGVNYNALLDRLISHNPADHYNWLPVEDPGKMSGWMVRKLLADYIDLPTGFNGTTYVDDVGELDPQAAESAFLQQGTVLRKQLEYLSLKNAAIYYVDAAKYFHYHSPESAYARWGFSDRPNNRTVLSSATTFTGATYGFREMDASEDITNLTNDVFVWGGSEFATEAGGTVFARSTSPTSIADHGLWQKAEVLFGDQRAGIYEQVRDIAQSIVIGPGDPYVSPGTDELGVVRNQSVPNWNLKLSWYAHDVPSLDGSGAKDHLTPGDFVTIVLWVHGTGPTNPLILTLPLRQVSISFPTLPTDGGAKTYVRFDGTFSLSIDDPVTIWESLARRRRVIRQTTLSTASPSTTAPPGALWQGAPSLAPNGTRTVFQLQSSGSNIRYISGTSEVYLGGLRLRQGADYSEQPTAGTVTLFAAPATGSELWVYVRLGT